jgi:hypothetical protein
MKKLLISLVAILISLISLSQTQDEIISYYNKIALKSEYDSIQLTTPYIWKKNIIIYIKCDNYRPIVIKQMVEEAKRVVKELNELITPINITFTNDSSKCNLFVYFGTHTTFNKLVPSSIKYTEDGLGLSLIMHDNFIIKHGYVYVDSYRVESISFLKHLVREEITQSLGLLNDTWDYFDSIFYQGWTNFNEYSNLDKNIIKMHYNN